MMYVKENDRSIDIPLKNVVLKGDLSVPPNATALVLFSHGSGSSRFSPRNMYVANKLKEEGLGTLLFDLLTLKEDLVYQTRFNIDLLTQRLVAVTKWVKRQQLTKDMALGYFGASTGAASAIRAAAHLGSDIMAVVSRGGRPDLAYSALMRLKAPTLLIVGGWDQEVLELNQKAYEKLNCKKKLEIIPQASHLFGEKGKLEDVARSSANWFNKWLVVKKEKNVQD